MGGTLWVRDGGASLTRSSKDSARGPRSTAGRDLRGGSMRGKRGGAKEDPGQRAVCAGETPLTLRKQRPLPRGDARSPVQRPT